MRTLDFFLLFCSSSSNKGKELEHAEASLTNDAAYSVI